MKTYLIQVPKLNGAINAKINGVDSFYLTTDGDYQGDNSYKVYVRNIPYSVSMHVRLYPISSLSIIDAQCWHDNHNDLIPASKAKSDYQRVNACYAKRLDTMFSNHMDTSISAKLKIQTEILKAINKFYQENKGEIDFQSREMAIEDATRKVNVTNDEIVKKQKEILDLEKRMQSESLVMQTLNQSDFSNWRNVIKNAAAFENSTK